MGSWLFAPMTGELGTTAEGGSQTLTGAGGALVITCTKVETSADFFNENAMGKGKDLSRKYTGCSVSKPTGCGYVTSSNENVNGTMKWASNIPSLAVEAGGAYQNEYAENSSGELVNIILEKSKGGGACGLLPKESKLKGSTLAKVNNSAKAFEFEGKSGEKKLEVSGLAATLVGTEELLNVPGPRRTLAIG